MSAPYKKAFRRIPNASKYLLDAAFEVKGYEYGIGAGINYFEYNEPEAYELLAFLEAADAPFWRHLGVFVQNSSGSHDELYYVSDPLPLPNVRSKKKRTQKHAKLVVLSNISRAQKKERDRRLNHKPSTQNHVDSEPVPFPVPVPTDGPF